jgi:hypothetical protein
MVDGWGRAVRNAAMGAVTMAAISAIGDAIWFELNLPHKMVYGLAHGTLLCAAIGTWLGALVRRALAGAAGGAAIGLAAAASYYVLAPFTGPGVMFVVWMALWVAIAALDGWLMRGRLPAGGALARGAAAAIASGLAFYAISGIWFHHEGPRNYAMHFASWMLPYFAAFIALSARRQG